MEAVDPIYESVPGWETDLKNFSDYSELPENAKKYIMLLEDYLNTPISMISVDPRRDKLILK